MSITVKTIKMLWGRSGSRCAICQKELVLDPVESDDDESIVGDMAHIIARKEGFTRGDYDSLPEDQRDRYSNLILLCKIHHKQIDDQPGQYTVEHLRGIKEKHEAFVRERLSPSDLAQQRDDEVYASYLQEFLQRVDIDNWTTRGTWICSSSGPSLTKEYYASLQDLGAWIISRVWLKRYPDLEAAFNNFKRVVADFLKTFSRYSKSEEGSDFIITRRFHKEHWVEHQEYERRLAKYNDHVALIEDLFFELTRALNYIFDLVRKNLLPTFRMREGVVLVQRDCIGFDMHSERLRMEYRGDERIDMPYPGLDKFLEIRHSRDFCAPNENDDEE